MPRQVDLKPQSLRLTHDPTNQITTDPGVNNAVKSLADVLGQLPKMIEDGIRNVIETLIGTAVKPITELAEWVGNLGHQITQSINDIAGIDLSSWDNFMASLHDGKGIDLPSIDFNLSGLITNLLMAPATVIGSIGQVVMDGVTTIQGFLNGLWEGLSGGTASTAKSAGHVKTAASSVNSTANTAKTNADTAVSNTYVMAAGAWDGWYDAGGSGAPSDLQTVVEAIKTTVAGGWTKEIITTSGTWTRPAPVADIIEFWVICVGSASGGDKGMSGGSAGGAGGPAGNYVAQQVNPADIASTVTCLVAAGGPGATTRVGAAPNNGGVTSFGSLASSAGVQGAAIASLLGFYNASNSAPGDGGNGGSASSSPANPGSAGASTPLATGGAGGAGVNAGNGGAGTPGGSASLTGQTLAGGGGGGGGGGTRGAGASGGAGGAGGFPGGGGGGGGAGNAAGAPGGNGGNGGNGVIVLLYRMKV